MTEKTTDLDGVEGIFKGNSVTMGRVFDRKKQMTLPVTGM